MIQTTSSPDSSKAKRTRNADQRFNRLTVLALALVGMLGVAAVAFYFFDVKLLNGQLGVLTALGAIGLLLIGQFIRFRERISLRTMMIIISVLAIGLAYVGRRMADSQAETDAVEKLVAAGATVTYNTKMEATSEYFRTDNGWYLPTWVQDWIGASYFGNVESLQFNDWKIDDRDLVQLQDIRSLSSLDMRASNVTAEGVAKMPLVPGIDNLSIAWEQLSPESAAHLAELPELRRLQIGFGNPAFGPNVNRPPSRFSVLSNLSELEFLSAELDTIDANQIRALASLPSLRSVLLSSVRAGRVNNPAGLAELGKSQTLRGITINISNFGDNELQSLGESSSLLSVYLIRTSVTADGVRAFREAHPRIHATVTPPIPGLDPQPRRRASSPANDGQYP